MGILISLFSTFTPCKVQFSYCFCAAGEATVVATERTSDSKSSKTPPQAAASHFLPAQSQDDVWCCFVFDATCIRHALAAWSIWLHQCNASLSLLKLNSCTRYHINLYVCANARTCTCGCEAEFGLISQRIACILSLLMAQGFVVRKCELGKHDVPSQCRMFEAVSGLCCMAPPFL